MLESLKAAATRQTRLYWGVRRAVVALTLTIILAGCAGPPHVVAQNDPADPGAPARPVTYRSTLGPYQSARPVDPAPWRQQNERVAPPSTTEGGSR